MKKLTQKTVRNFLSLIGGRIRRTDFGYTFVVDQGPYHTEAAADSLESVVRLAQVYLGGHERFADAVLSELGPDWNMEAYTY